MDNSTQGSEEPSDETVPLLTRRTGQQSSLVTVLALWNTMIATSVLSLPWAVRESGLLLGVMLLTVVAAIMGYTCYLVLKSVDKLADGQLLEFHDVCGLCLGPWAKLLALTGSLLSLLCGMIVYWILLTNFLYHIGNFAHNRLYGVSDESSDVSEHYDNAVCRAGNMTTLCSSEWNGTLASGQFQRWWSKTGTIPLYLIPLLFPLLNFKSPAIFARMNSLGMCSLVYLFVFVAVKAVSWGVNLDLLTASPDSDLYNSHYGPQFRSTFPALTGVAALGYFVQNSVLPIVRNQKHPQNNTRDLVLAYILVAVTYIYVGGVFYITFPFNKNCITDNLLDNIASSDVLGLVARAGLFFQLTCIFPQLAYIARIQLFSILFTNPWPSVFHVLALNATLVTTCVLFAVFLPHVGRILSFVGALCGLYYAIGLPCMVKCVSLKQDRRLTGFQVAFHILLVLLGFANFVGQFFVMDHT